MTTIDLRHCSILEFGRGASNQAVAPGIIRPLLAIGERLDMERKYMNSDKAQSKKTELTTLTH